MEDFFSITEQPSPLPEAVRSIDLASTMREQIARIARLENTLEDERVASKKVMQRFLIGLLDVADALDRMLQQPNDGTPVGERQHRNLELTRKLLGQRLATQGVVPLDLLGQPFDPAVADAEDDELAPNMPEETVIRELAKGYRWDDILLRRAKVIVSRQY